MTELIIALKKAAKEMEEKVSEIKNGYIDANERLSLSLKEADEMMVKYQEVNYKLLEEIRKRVSKEDARIKKEKEREIAKEKLRQLNQIINQADTDKDHLMHIADDLNAIFLDRCTTPYGKHIESNIEALLEKVVSYIYKKINDMK